MSEKKPSLEGPDCYTEEESRLAVAFRRVTDGDTAAWPDLESACRKEFLAKLEFINRGLAEDALQETLLMITGTPS